MPEAARPRPAVSWASLIRFPGIIGTIAFIGYLAWNVRWLAASRVPPSILIEIFGIPAPTTGMTRSTVALLDGEWKTAFLWNPLTIPCYLILAWTAVEILPKLRRKQHLALSKPLAVSWPALLLTAWVTKFMLGPQWW